MVAAANACVVQLVNSHFDPSAGFDYHWNLVGVIDDDRKGHYHLRFDSGFSRWTWISRFPLCVFLEDSLQGWVLQTVYCFSDPTDSVKTLQERWWNGSHQWPGFILHQTVDEGPRLSVPVEYHPMRVTVCLWDKSVGWIIIIIIHTFLYQHKVVTSEAMTGADTHGDDQYYSHV